MLVLSRKVNERIQIGDDCVLTVVRVRNGSVRLGIEAPREVRILREEIKDDPPREFNSKAGEMTENLRSRLT